MAIDKYEAPQGMLAVEGGFSGSGCGECFYRRRTCPSVPCTPNLRSDATNVYFIEAPTTDIVDLCIAECERIAKEAIDERGEIEEAHGARLCVEALLKLKSTKEV